MLASQRIETALFTWLANFIGFDWSTEDMATKRGSPPSMIEWLILAWVSGKDFLNVFNHF